MNIKNVVLVFGLIVFSNTSLSAITPQQSYIAATATIGFIEGVLPDDIPRDQRRGIFFALCANYLMTLWMEDTKNHTINSNSWLQFIVSYWAGEYAGVLAKAFFKHYRNNQAPQNDDINIDYQ